MNTKTNVRAGLSIFSPQRVNQLNAANVTTTTNAVGIVALGTTAVSNVTTRQNNSAVVVS